MKPKKKRKNKPYDFSPNYVRRNRTFPVFNTVLLVILVAVQIALIVTAVLYESTPQDIIKHYEVTVEPLEDGSLDIEYAFEWEPLDATEPLTWVSIGMANYEYTVYKESLSKNIKDFYKLNTGDTISLELHLNGAYYQGDVINFSFKVNQKHMLCQDDNGYFYEFIPGWFNEIPVESYVFRWKQNDGSSAICEPENGYYTWSGSFDCGGYESMLVRYSSEAFEGAETVEYLPFDDSGVYNGHEDDKISVIVLVCIGIFLIAIVELVIVDSYVSYNRGRGFLSGYGHHLHVYGRRNPRYIHAYHVRSVSHGGRSGFGGGFGGGCACACACACAGGGRAGCSQKDTYISKNGENSSADLNEA